MARQILVIRQSSSLRAITEEEALQALSPDERGLPRRDVEVATAQFADAVRQGDWGGHDTYLREAAAKIRALADQLGDVAVHYVGLAEVPHVVALGAHLGSERVIVAHDHHGEAGPWQWPATEQTINLKTVGTEELKVT